MVGSIWLNGITVALTSSTQVKSLVVCAPFGWRGQAGLCGRQVCVQGRAGQCLRPAALGGAPGWAVNIARAWSEVVVWVR